MEINQYKGMNLIDYLKEGLFDIESDGDDAQIIYNDRVLWEDSDGKYICKVSKNNDAYIEHIGKLGRRSLTINKEGYDCFLKLKKFGVKNFYFNNWFSINDRDVDFWDFKGINLFTDRGPAKIFIKGKNGGVKNLNIDTDNSDVEIHVECSHTELENIEIKNCKTIYLSVIENYNIKKSTFECDEFIIDHYIPVFDKSFVLKSKKDIIKFWGRESVIQRIASGRGFDYIDENTNLSGLNDELKKNYQIYMQGLRSRIHCTLVHKSNPNFKKVKTGIDHGDWKIYKIRTTP